jgi:hypothetical protein
LAVSAIVASGLGLAPASANLIQNGTFATPNVGGGWNIYANGGVSGWTSNNNETEIDYQTVVMPSFYLGTPGQSMELNGNIPDTISQSVTGLTVGAKYTLSWGYGDRPGGGPYLADVSFGGNLVTTDSGIGSGLWTSNSFVVTATAGTEDLSFAAQNGGSYGNEIADVSLTAVPEPSSLALVGLAMLAFGLIRRKRA